MSESKAITVQPQGRDIATMKFGEALDYYAPQFADALPDNMPLQRFKRTVVTAINQNPDLLGCDRRSLFLACVRCAQDGLYPDGREAALVAFGKQVQYLPMIGGIRKRMRNSGEVLSAIAEVVYERDTFHFYKGEDARIEHIPCALDEEPGRPIGAYAIIKLKNGEVLREVMSYAEIERIRTTYSRTPNGPAWTKSWGEQAKKTVLRRCSKSAPISAEVDRLFDRDEEPVGVPHYAPPPPRRDDFPEPTQSTKTPAAPEKGSPEAAIPAQDDAAPATAVSETRVRGKRSGPAVATGAEVGAEAGEPQRSSPAAPPATEGSVEIVGIVEASGERSDPAYSFATPSGETVSSDDLAEIIAVLLDHIDAAQDPNHVEALRDNAQHLVEQASEEETAMIREAFARAWERLAATSAKLPSESDRAQSFLNQFYAKCDAGTMTPNAAWLWMIQQASGDGDALAILRPMRETEVRRMAEAMAAKAAPRKG